MFPNANPNLEHLSQLTDSFKSVVAQIQVLAPQLNDAMNRLNSSLEDNPNASKELVKQIDMLYGQFDAQFKSAIFVLKATLTYSKIARKLDMLRVSVSSGKELLQVFLNNNSDLLSQCEQIKAKLNNLTISVRSLQENSSGDDLLDYGGALISLMQFVEKVAFFGTESTKLKDSITEKVSEQQEIETVLDDRLRRARQTGKYLRHIVIREIMVHLGWVGLCVTAIINVFSDVPVSDKISLGVVLYTFVNPIINLALTTFSVKKSTFPSSTSIKLVQGIVGVILGYSALYHTLWIIQPDDFNHKLTGLKSIYYSITTFTTTGYGDILPTGWLSQLVASSEMLLGFATSTFIMAMIVSLFLRPKPTANE